MALLPILAFFFCSAGPFLFTIFAIRRLVDKIRGKEREPIDTKIGGSSKAIIFEKVQNEEEKIETY